MAEAVQIAGGLTQQSKHSQVVLFRRVNDDLVETRLLNLKKMLNQRNLKEDAHLRPGDLVFVPQNTISKIARFLTQTVPEHVRQPDTILEKDFPDSHASRRRPKSRSRTEPSPTMRELAMVMFRQRKVFVCVSSVVLALALLYHPQRMKRRMRPRSKPARRVA